MIDEDIKTDEIEEELFGDKEEGLTGVDRRDLRKIVREFKKSKDRKKIKEDIARAIILIIAMDLLSILSSYLSLTSAQIGQYPNNVQENYRKRLKIIGKVKDIFNPKRGKQKIVSLDELVDHFQD